jgi:Fe2+ or Zn2+ uptake regulation protein
MRDMTETLNMMEKTVYLYLRDYGKEIDAETLWLELKKNGAALSIGSVYLKLKKLENEGLVLRIYAGGRKFVYKCKI